MLYSPFGNSNQEESIWKREYIIVDAVTRLEKVKKADIVRHVMQLRIRSISKSLRMVTSLSRKLLIAPAALSSAKVILIASHALQENLSNGVKFMVSLLKRSKGRMNFKTSDGETRIPLNPLLGRGVA